MAWEDLDQKQGGAGTGRFVSFKEGGSRRFRVLDAEPHTTMVHKISQIVNGEDVFRTVPATANLDDDYIQRMNGKRYPANPVFNLRVFEYAKENNKDVPDKGEIKILQGGPQIFKALRGLWEDHGHLNQFDVIIKKEGEKRDTEYTVTAAPKSFDVDVDDLTSQMEQDETLAWENVFKPITAADQQKILAEAKLDINYDPAATIAETLTIDEASATVFPFGKYKGKKLGELAVIDAGYLEWAAENVTSNDAVAAGCRVLVGAGGKIAAKETPKAALPSAKKAEKAKPATKGISEERRAELKEAVETAFEDYEATDIVAKIKEHGGGKARLKDLTGEQLQALHNDICA